MVKKDLTQVQTELSNVHQQLMAGEIYLEAINQIDQLIPEVKRSRRTAVTMPENSPRIYQLFADFIDSIQQGRHMPMNDDLVQAMIEYSTTEEMHVRRMILITLQLGLENNLVSTDQLKSLFRYFSQPQVLFAHITEPDNKAAYGRSIAVNVIRLILIADRSGYFFLTQNDLTAFLNQVGVLPILERDSRGFVSNVGWVHLFTGLANLMSELCEHDELVRGDKIFLLATLIEGYKNVETIFSMGEDEDIANFLIKLFGQHQLYQDFFIEQLQIWRTELNQFNPYSKEEWNRLFNYRHLMQSLIIDGNLPAKVMKAIVTDNN